MTAASLLRASRRASGLSQVELAVRASTSQSDVSSMENGRRVPTVDTLERLLRQAGHRIALVPNVGADADETASRIADALQRTETDAALRAFLDYSDALARADGTSRVLLSALEPTSTGSARWDAGLAALADYWLSDSQLPTPGWVDSPGRSLREPVGLGLGIYDVIPDVGDVPAEFLKRNVLVHRATIASV